jgi:hypothetical protein
MSSHYAEEVPCFTMSVVKAWSPPVMLPKLCSEYASVRLEPVDSIPPYVTRAYERYIAKKGELQCEKDALTKKIADLEAKLSERVVQDQSKYRPRGWHEDPVTKGMRDEIAKETVTLKGMSQRGDTLDEDNKAVQEYMILHKKMEECYVVTKELQDASRASWAAMYSSV